MEQIRDSFRCTFQETLLPAEVWLTLRAGNTSILLVLSTASQLQAFGNSYKQGMQVLQESHAVSWSSVIGVISTTHTFFFVTQP
jgi:hypothetical protein